MYYQKPKTLAEKKETEANLAILNTKLELFAKVKWEEKQRAMQIITKKRGD